MRAVEVALEPASAIPLASLARLFTASYEGYAFRVSVDDRALAAFVHERSIDLSLSRVAAIDGRPVGLALVGLRGALGYVAVVGVIPEARHHGVARDLLRAAEDALRGGGAREARLDVLAENAAAIALYESAGWRSARALPSYRVRELVARNLDLRETALPRDETPDLPWQNSLSSARLAQARAFASEAGVAIVKPSTGGLVVYDVRGPDSGRVVDGLGALFPGAGAHYLMVSDGAVARELERRGWERFTIEVEMRRSLC